jgi:hypothetical protein
MARHTAILWNVERLLRPRPSAVGRALGMTSASGWTPAAYKAKLANVAAVLRAASPGGPPALLALVEVEGAAVVRDLIRATGWTRLADTQVPDESLDGYDVALLYSRDVFTEAEAARSFNFQNRFATRDVLSVSLKTAAGAPLRVACTHWASRRLTNAEPLRISAADYCSRLISTYLKFSRDELMTPRGRGKLPARTALEARWNTPVLVLGDFNDNPFDTSVGYLLDSTRFPDMLLRPPRFPVKSGSAAVEYYLDLRPRLFNLAWRLLTDAPRPPTRAHGTAVYAGDWYVLDQVLCSRGLLLPDARVSVPLESVRVFGPPTVPDERGRPVKVSTGSGEPAPFDMASKTGVSDHLPVVFELEIAD